MCITLCIVVYKFVYMRKISVDSFIVFLIYIKCL